MKSISVFLSALFLASANSAHALEPIPTYYEDPGLSRNRDYVNQHVNEHIDPFTGKLQLHYVDLFIPGNGGLDIAVQRSYNSQSEQLTEPTALGVGWTIHYGRVLRNASQLICDNVQLNTAKSPVLELPDGSRQILYLSFDRTFWLTTSRWKAVCRPNGIGMDVRSPDGTLYEMTTEGVIVGSAGATQRSYYTTRMIDRNGNTLSFSYTQFPRATGISVISANDGRQVVFTYNANATLAQISDNGGRIWGYSYTFSANAPDFPFLTTVRRPDGIEWRYDYNLTQVIGGSPGTYSMKRVTYPGGGTFDYSYGFVSFNAALPRTTVVTSKTGAGGDWTFSYLPASVAAQAGGAGVLFTQDEMYDRTIATGPDGVHYYMHVGANSVGPGTVYAIGLLLFKTIDNGLQNEAYSWDVQGISDMINKRPGNAFASDQGIYVPLLSEKTIQRNGQSYTTSYGNFDDYGNAQTITETGTTTRGALDARTTSITYDVRPAQWILHLPATQSVSNVPGTITRLYDGNGNLQSENKYGVVTSYTYNSEGEIQTKKDARGNISTYLNYFRGIPQSENHPEGVTVTRVVDNAGNIQSQTDGEHVTTQFQYDGLNRITKITHATGNQVDISWTPLQRVVTRGAYQETTAFDAYGRTDSVTHAGAGTTITQTFINDAVGRRIYASYPNQTVGTAFWFDALGRAYATFHAAQPSANNSVTNTGGIRWDFFDHNMVRTTNERNYVFVNRFRGYGDPDHQELMAIQAPDPAANVDFFRNGLGQPTQIVQGGLTRALDYDSKYFLWHSTDPEVGTTNFGRDEVGNMISKQVATSPVTNYVYDGRNRLKTVQYPAGTPSVSRTYYLDDKVKSIDNVVSRRDYVYGLNKLLSNESLTVGARTLTAAYNYNANDALQSVNYGSGLIIDYGPDAFGRPTQATPFASQVAFFPNGQLQGLRYANGIVTSFGLNNRLWPDHMVVSQASGASLFDMRYFYENSGNVLNISESVNAIHDRAFRYDPLDRLTGFDTPAALGGVIGYDSVGNIRSKSIGTSSLTYQFDASNRLASVTGSRNQAFGYDVYGNVSSNSLNQFQYDDASTLRCVDCGLATEIRYDYDGTGIRVSEQKGALTTYFLYGSKGDLLYEVDTAGTTREYAYVGGRNIAKRETR